MCWNEFVTLLAGINAETPLGAIVSIRSEKDPKRIKEFSPEQKRIYREWQKKQASEMTREEYEEGMKMFSNIFKGISMSQNKNNLTKEK